jgi:hypothetical protein
MAYNAHNMSLTAFVINGATHGFAINSQSFIFFCKLLVPPLQCSIEFPRIDTD